MQGLIHNFRRARHHTYKNHMIVLVEGIDGKEKAKGLVGKEVVYTTEGKEKKQIKGKVASSHGNKGALRVIFETGMPGQSIGRAVEIK